MNTPMAPPRTVTMHGYSLTDVGKRLGLSRGFLNGQIKQGRLIARRFGRRRIVLHDDLRKYLEAQKA
jgi:excisionase family DNA binding protein